MTRMENLVREALVAHEDEAPAGIGLLQAVQRGGTRARRRSITAWSLAAAGVVGLGYAGTALPWGAGAVTAISAVSPAGSGHRASTATVYPCTPAIRRVMDDPFVPGPTGSGSTPMNDPVAEAVQQAVGDQGRGAFADVYGTQALDNRHARVVLCVTDLARGHALAAAAKRAHPDLDLSRLDLYLCRYSRRQLDQALQRLMDRKLFEGGFGFPVSEASAGQEAAGLELGTTAAGVRSTAFLDRLMAATGGIPVRLYLGRTVTFAGPLTVTSAPSPSGVVGTPVP